MATSGSSEGGFSGRSGFVLRVGIARLSIVNSTTNRWRINVQAINRSGYVSYDLTARPWSISGTFNNSGSWVPDFRNGDVITLWSADINVGTNSDGYDTISWSASAGPAGIFGSASTSGSFAASRIPQVPDTPDKPVNRGELLQATTMTIGFPAPDDDGGSSIDSYSIHVSKSSSFSTLSDSRRISPGDRANQTFTGLDPVTTYYIRHRANNGVGSSNWSATLAVTTKVGPASAPRSLSITDPGPSDLKLNWLAPSDDGGGSISQYTIQRADNSSFSQGLVTYTVNGSTLSRVISGLDPSTTYYFRVKATNAWGDGPWSSAISGMTVSGAYVSINNSWKGAGVFVSDGTTWEPATIAVSDGTVWEDAE